jgi:DNA segregation ATPase FtsK/SpoIIIE, S-DNA-T family
VELALRLSFSGEIVDVLVEFDEQSRVADLGKAIACHKGIPTIDRLYVGDETLDDETLIAQSGIVDGAVLGIGRPAASPVVVEPPPLAIVTVTAGPKRGQTAAVRASTFVVGRLATADVVIKDVKVTRLHAEFRIHPDGVAVTDLGSRNGTWVDGQPASGVVPFGTPITMGDTTLVVETGSVLGEPGQLFDDPNDHTIRLFTRASRERDLIEHIAREVPTPPERPESPRVPAAGIIGSLLLGSVMFLITRGQQGGSSHAALYLVFAIGSPILIAGNVMSDRLAVARRHRRAVTDFEAERAQLLREAESRRRKTETRARADAPGPAELLGICRGATSRLWERSDDDADFLSLRVGLRDTELTLGLGRPNDGDPALRDAVTARAMPQNASLARLGGLGVCGPRELSLPLAQWLALQVCGLHSPADVRLVIVAPGRADDWQWAAWTPHNRPFAGSDCRRLVADDSEQAHTRLAEVAALIRERRNDEQATRDGFVWPAVVVVVDGMDASSNRLTQTVVQQGPAVAVYTLVLADSPAQLPAAVKHRIDVGPAGSDLRLSNAPRTSDIVVDRPDREALEASALALAPLRDVGATGGPGGVPRRVRMAELFPGCSSGEGVLASWAANEEASTIAAVGIGDGGPIALDLSGQNSNALIAGMIGSGKSEFLQTLVASLALVNRPEWLNFVLIDFKGGTAFKDAKDLPHVVGMVANLDGSVVERAVHSLTAEKERRERLFQDHDVSDLPSYWARTGNTPVLPRVIVVIDEFAELARSHPDLLDQFVSVSSVGRGLGLHLVLGTQSPEGVVSHKIRHNVGVRVCLRVAKPEASRDVIEVGDAARIDDQIPGRAIIRLGDRLTECQTAWVGWPTGAEARRTDVTITDFSFAVLGAAAPRARTQRSLSTDLHDIVRAVRDAASKASAAPVWRPWRDALPDTIDRSDERLAPLDDGLLIGLEDRPATQDQEPFGWVPQTGSLLAVGGPRSGRSTLARTIALSAAESNSADRLHLYVIDGSPQDALGDLVALPHTGAVVRPNEHERLRRLVNHLRSQCRGESAYGRPPIVVVINHAERLLPDDVSRIDFERVQLVRELVDLATMGPAVGLFVAVTTSPDGLRAEGEGWRALPNRLVLPLASADDYYRVDEALRPPSGKRPPGRALLVGAGTEVQVARSTGPLPSLTIATVSPPAVIDPLPDDLSLSGLTCDREGELAVIGVGGDILRSVSIDFAESPVLVVAGFRRSGKSTTLATIVAGYRGGRRVMVVTGRVPNAALVHALEGQGGHLLAPGEVSDVVGDDRMEPSLVVVDDAAFLSEPQAHWDRFAKSLDHSPHALVIAVPSDDLEAYGKWWRDLHSSYGLGVMLSVSDKVHRPFGVSFSSADLDARLPTGRAWLCRNGTKSLVQVAHL